MDGRTLVFLTATVRVSFAVLTPLKFPSSDSSDGKTGGASSKVFDLAAFDELSHVLEPGLLVPGPPPPPYYHPPPSPHPHPHPFFLPPGTFNFGHHAPYHAPCMLQCNILPQHSVYSKPTYPYPPRGSGGGGGGGGAGGIMPRKVKPRPHGQGIGSIPPIQGVILQDPGLIQQITGAIRQGQVGLLQNPGQVQQVPGRIQQGQVTLLQTPDQIQQVPGPFQQDQLALLQTPGAMPQGQGIPGPVQHISGAPQQSQVAFLPTPGTIPQGQDHAPLSQGGITQAIFPELEQLKSPQEHSCVSTKEEHSPESTSSPPATTVNDNDISFMTEDNGNENVDMSEDFN